jgi:hypothetical protein
MTASHFSTCMNASWSAELLRRGSIFGGAVTVSDMIALPLLRHGFFADEAGDYLQIV